MSAQLTQMLMETEEALTKLEAAVKAELMEEISETVDVLEKIIERLSIVETWPSDIRSQLEAIQLRHAACLAAVEQLKARHLLKCEEVHERVKAMQHYHDTRRKQLR